MRKFTVNSRERTRHETQDTDCDDFGDFDTFRVAVRGAVAQSNENDVLWKRQNNRSHVAAGEDRVSGRQLLYAADLHPERHARRREQGISKI